MSRRGQATTEYLFFVVFLAVGLAVAAYAFLPSFEDGMDGLQDDTTALIGAGTENGRNDKR